VVLLLLSPATALADVVYGNDFKYENRDELQRLERTYFIANGPDGYVIVRDEPGSPKDTMTTLWGGEEEVHFDNGVLIWMDYVYLHEGEYWGSIQEGHGVQNPGWIPMDDLLQYYSHLDFLVENEAELYEFSGDFNELSKIDEICLWQWPGSDREKIIFTPDFESIDIDSENDIRARYAYMDDEGRQWVYIIFMDGFTYGMSRGYSSEGWVCFDDPSNAGSIPAFNPAPEPMPWSPDGSDIWTNHETTNATNGDDDPDDTNANVPNGDDDPDDTNTTIISANNDHKGTNKDGFLVPLLIVGLAILLIADITVLIIVIRKRKNTK